MFPLLWPNPWCLKREKGTEEDDRGREEQTGGVEGAGPGDGSFRSILIEAERLSSET